MKNYLPEGRLIDTAENAEFMKNEETLAEAIVQRKVLEARAILCDSAHNLVVDLGCMKGFIPRDEGALGLDSGQVRDIALISRVNKPVCFVVNDIIERTSGVKQAILSRKAVQQRCMNEYIGRLLPGQVIDARISHFESFGAFCDIGCGIPSLIPIDAISVSRISHPSDRFSLSEDVKVIVKCVEPDGRVMLSHKELLGTWEENAGEFNVGETVSGIIRSIESYGVFVELTPNLAGLAEVFPTAKVGQRASVYIKSIIKERMKIKLIIIDAADDDVPLQKTKYFYNGDRIANWQYSPKDSEKNIHTDFIT